MSPGVARAPRVVVVQTMIPDYRTRFFERLNEELGEDLVLLTGSDDWSLDIVHVDAMPSVRVRNRYFARRRLLWQSGVLGPAVSADVAVLGLNPRIVSSWVVLGGRRLRRRRTVLWGHAWPRRGRSSRSNRIRSVMRRLADTVIVYTETEARELREASPRTDVVAAPNALYTRDDIGPAHAEAPTDFLYVGRLNASKKPGLLLEAFQIAASELAEDVRLVFVGEGPLRGTLEDRVRVLGLARRVIFLGFLSQTSALAQAYARAIASVSPGYAGLSVIQSLGYGVPTLVARDEPHAPEIEAVVDGSNGSYFASDSPVELASSLVTIAADRAKWVADRPRIAEAIRSTYSVEQMVAGFVRALRLEDTDRPLPPENERSERSMVGPP